MIPTNKQLHKVSRNLKFEEEDYFSLCHEYSELKKIFMTTEIFDIINLFFDMILYPLYILYKILTKEFSVLDIMSIVRFYDLWKQWFRYDFLHSKLFVWKIIVRSLGGPWISSSNPSYHALVYADGMTRISESRKKPKSV